MRALPRQGTWVAALAVFAAAALLRALGVFQPLEYAAADARARAFEHAVESDIVIVGIDARSLAALDRWPWQRRHHASLIARLSEAGAERIFLDVDFSSPSNALDDAAFEAALARPDGSSIVLPAFFQPASANDPRLRLSRPLARFLPHVEVAAVNRVPASDGLERAWLSSWYAGAQRYRSIIDLDARLPPETPVSIDFSISPRSFTYLSYADVLEHRLPPAALAGKTVFVGATAVELGDMVPVPVHRSLPGVVVQALAVESVRAGPQWSPPDAAVLAALAAWTGLLAVLLRGRGWRRGAAMLAGALAVLAAGSVALYAGKRWLVEVVPFAFATAGVFVALVLRSLDEQTWRAVTYALGMRRRDALLKSVVQSSADCIVCLDAAGVIHTVNPAAESLFGCPASELVGAPIARFIPGLAVEHGDETQAFALLEGRITEWEASTAGGRSFPVDLAVSRVRLRDERLYTAIVRNVSERKAQQRRLEHQATHDSLTQLPNRAALMHRLERALAGGAAPRGLALLMLDLCRFKEINDTLGHHIGDEVLCEVGRRFRRAIGERGFIARIGGDEFTVLLDDPVVVDGLCQQLAECLARPIDVTGVSVEVGLSIGIARAPDDGADAGTLLRRADIAMYAAKRRGSSFEAYDASQDHHSLRRLSMGSELRAAIGRNELELHYQPKVNLRTRRTESVEALLRWPHPVYGPVSPAEFIAFAETTDLIRPLTEWTLRRALADGRAWRAAGIEARIAVNLSARLLQDTAFPALLRALLDEARAQPESLELEITESAMMADPARALRVVQEIHAIGVPIAIDDFGSGYSSLAYLRDLPVHSLKLDKSFVSGMHERPDDRVIVESTAQMAHALRLEVVAEGVETAWEAEFLAAAGYDYGQGYHYSAALPAATCAEWITRFNGAATSRSGQVRKLVVAGR
jgi:diguanylate cyclase (GGDEF)-like protein/PAS domain S-box-containing protein